MVEWFKMYTLYKHKVHAVSPYQSQLANQKGIFIK